MPEPVHINLQAAVTAAVSARDAIRQAAEDAKREDNAVTPTPIGGTFPDGSTRQ